jgi:hypothetical protein
MRNSKVTLGMAALALIGAFLPIAATGDLYVTQSYLGGISFLLYLIPVPLAIFAVMDMNGRSQIPLSVFCIWLALGGLAVTALSFYQGYEHLQAMASMESSFNNFFGSSSPTSSSAAPVSVMPGSGVILCGVSYLIAAVTSMGKVRATS